MKAKAVVFKGPGQVAFEEVSCPDPADDQVVVNVTHSWISNGTEGSYLRGERIDGDTPRREGDPFPFPIVAGYQKVGLVDWVGSEIDDLKKGDSVFAIVGEIEGMFAPRGGHVSPSVSTRGSVFKLPPDCDPVDYSGLVLTQVGYNCGKRPQLEAGDAAVVVGDGLVGHWAAQMLAFRGAEVILIGRHLTRLSHFKKGDTLLAENDSWVAQIRERFPQGIQVGVDTVGRIEIMEQLQSLMKPFGHLVSAGFYGSNDRFALQPARYKELSIDLVSGATPDRLQETLKLVEQGILDTKSLITHRFPATRAAGAWELINSGSESALGVVLDW